MWTGVALAAVAAGSGVLLATFCSPAGSATAKTSTTFAYTGAPQTYRVPAGICTVTIPATGASGGGVFPEHRPAGPRAGPWTGRAAAAAGAVLDVRVGGVGVAGVDVGPGTVPTSPGGYNGGGTGGGAAPATS